MTANEFNNELKTILDANDEKKAKSLVEKFMLELSVEISNTTAHKVTALTGGLVSGLLRQYADAIDKHTDIHGKMLATVFFAGAKTTVYSANVPLGIGEEK